MSDRPLVTPNVLVGGDDPVARAQDILGRLTRGSEDGSPDLIVHALNAATACMEKMTNRRLRSRTYRETTAISCTSTVDSETVTGAGFLNLKNADDAVGANLDAGSRIDTIASDGSLTLTKKARASGAATVTFGSVPIVVDGDGTSVIRIPEYPVSEVYSVTSVDTLGVETAHDLTNARLERTTGKLILATEATVKGLLNVRIECKAGYVQPSASQIGDWEDWNDLEKICLRLTQIMFQDYAQQVGRFGDKTIVQFTQHLVSFELPADLIEALGKYRRIW